jgi:hypothetical protein
MVVRCGSAGLVATAVAFNLVFLIVCYDLDCLRVHCEVCHNFTQTLWLGPGISFSRKCMLEGDCWRSKGIYAELM